MRCSPRCGGMGRAPERDLLISSMPSEPPDFDARDWSQVLRLRLRDRFWQAAIVIAVATVTLGSLAGWRAAPLLWLERQGAIPFGVLVVVAGIRWCWVGRLTTSRGDRCGACGDSMRGVDPAARCPECGAEDLQRRAARSVPVARLILDLPGVLAAILGAWIAIGWWWMLRSGLFDV